MLQLQNSTPFAVSMALFPNEDAIDTLYVMVKATFNISQQLTLADEQSPLVAADVYWSEPGKSSLKYASDFHIGKAATDIIMLGHACAPNKQEASQLDVTLSVGHLSKTVRVFGDRQWREGRITPPASFTTMPMVYEKAFGGVHVVNGQPDEVDARNPVGRGFAGTRNSEEMNGVPLPNLEDPAQLIQAPIDQPTPACFASCAPNWQPRVAYAGTYDEQWQTSRAPYLPQDFDKRFLNVAHPDLVYPGYLQGGEPVQITHMHPAGVLKFDVPRVQLYTRVMMADSEVIPDFELESLILEPNQLRMSLVWRAAVQCDKQTLKISDIKISLSR
jgi:hypothetical protein